MHRVLPCPCFALRSFVEDLISTAHGLRASDCRMAHLDALTCWLSRVVAWVSAIRSLACHLSAWRSSFELSSRRPDKDPDGSCLAVAKDQQ